MGKYYRESHDWYNFLSKSWWQFMFEREFVTSLNTIAIRYRNPLRGGQVCYVTKIHHDTCGEFYFNNKKSNTIVGDCKIRLSVYNGQLLPIIYDKDDNVLLSSHGMYEDDFHWNVFQKCYYEITDEVRCLVDVDIIAVVGVPIKPYSLLLCIDNMYRFRYIKFEWLDCDFVNKIYNNEYPSYGNGKEFYVLLGFIMIILAIASYNLITTSILN